jgi:simple sugar transport system permease protein
MAVGILATTAVALGFPGLPGWSSFPLRSSREQPGSGLGFHPGILEIKARCERLLSTVMLNYIAAQLYTFFLRGPMLDRRR